MIGIVEKFDSARCFGWIRGADECNYFCHSHDVLGSVLTEGCRVEFTPGYARGRGRALEVVRMEPARPDASPLHAPSPPSPVGAGLGETTGVVRVWDEARSFGWVVTARGNVFCHRADVIDDVALQPGQRVAFVTIRTARGARATAVRRVEEVR